jgi:hypothetical protein
MSTPEQQLAVLHACALLRIHDLEATLREIRALVERQHWGILGHYFDGVAAGAVPPLYYAAETPANAWLCVCGLTVKKRYTCLCGGREDNSTSDRASETEGK